MLQQRLAAFDVEPIRRQILSFLSRPRALILPDSTGEAEDFPTMTLAVEEDAKNRTLARMYQFSGLFGANILDFRDEQAELLPLAMRRMSLRQKLGEVTEFPSLTKAIILSLSEMSSLVSTTHLRGNHKKPGCCKADIEAELLSTYVKNGGLVVVMAGRGTANLRPTVLSDMFPGIVPHWRIHDWSRPTTAGPDGYRYCCPTLHKSSRVRLTPQEAIADEFFPGYFG